MSLVSGGAVRADGPARAPVRPAGPGQGPGAPRSAADIVVHPPDDWTTGAALCPAVAMYGPYNVRGLKVGDSKLWCACGLSRGQPWCDGSHVGTGIRPLKWTVKKNQVLHELCVCKYTRDPPYCDATHVNLPCDVIDRQDKCSLKNSHPAQKKLCTACGWVPDF